MSIDTASAGRGGAQAGMRRWLDRNRGLGVAILVFVGLLIVVESITAYGLTYFDIQSLSATGTASALAAMGQTLVVLTGGFDLSAGAVISLVNVTLASEMGMTADPMTQILLAFAGLGIGASVGLVNGVLVAFLRLQPIVVTLSTMFIVQGLTLLVMDKPGGFTPYEFSLFFTGDVISGVLPAPILIIILAMVAWRLVARSRLGNAIYAVGSDEAAAAAAGVRTRLTKLMAYVLAGTCYGAAGVFFTAQIGAGDPLVGRPMLLPLFAAIVIGGTRLGGGRGGLIGSVFGAYILAVVATIIFVLSVSAYFTTIVEGVILLLAVIAASLDRTSPLFSSARQIWRRIGAFRRGILPSQIRTGAAPPNLSRPAVAGAMAEPGWLTRHQHILRFIWPAYACFLVVLVATQIVYGGTLFNWGYYNSLIVLSSFMLVLALGQGAVILTGGLDLSVPWTIGLCGIVAAGVMGGENANIPLAMAAALGAGLLTGLFNGLGVVLLGLSPIVTTLAANGILQGLALLYSDGTPDGFAAPGLRWFMTDQSFGVTPVVFFMTVFVGVAILLLGHTAFGRRVFAVGNSLRVAQLSGVNTGRTIVGVYMLSGLCAALVGVMLAGFSGQASLGMGDDYLLPSIAVVVVGGTLITGGRGSYVGMIGGVLLLVALQTLLAGTTLPVAFRDIIFGFVVLAAVLVLRERAR